VADHSFLFRSGGNFAMLAAAVGVPFRGSPPRWFKIIAKLLGTVVFDANN
jgi:hypothetical protein